MAKDNYQNNHIVGANALFPVEGGVCAPAGFAANGICCNQETDNVSRETNLANERENVSLILADNRYPTACIYAQGSIRSASALVSERHVKSGYARAIIVNSGTANVCGEGSEQKAREVCKALEKRAKIPFDQVVVASTGRMGKRFPLNSVICGVDGLISGLGKTQDHSFAAAQAIANGGQATQLSFKFSLWGTPCKIGAIFSVGAAFVPTGALCLLTTDVDISAEMLKKALFAAVNDTFHATDVSGTCSPNDTVCIMSSGCAGNWKIDRVGTDYRKFLTALIGTIKEVCRRMVLSGENRLLECKITGAKSKNAARNMARAVVSSHAIKASLAAKRLDVDTLICALHNTGEYFSTQTLKITLKDAHTAIVLWEEGQSFCVVRQKLQEVLKSKEIALEVEVNGGNYASQAIGRIE